MSRAPWCAAPSGRPSREKPVGTEAELLVAQRRAIHEPAMAGRVEIELDHPARIEAELADEARGLGSEVTGTLHLACFGVLAPYVLPGLLAGTRPPSQAPVPQFTATEAG